PKGRGKMVERALAGQPVSEVAAAFATTPKTVKKWVNRFQAERAGSLDDRAARPPPLPRATHEENRHMSRPLVDPQVSGRARVHQTGLSPSTVSRIVRAARLSGMKDWQSPEPVVRYERKTPGELIHLDIKKLGRFEQIGHRITGDRTRQSSSRGRRGGQSWGA